MKRLFEAMKVDAAVKPQALNNSNVTGSWFPLYEYGEMLVVLLVGAMAATKTAAIELLQAQDASGTGAKAITGKSATVTANALATKATLTLASVAAGDTVTINGVTFTAHATTTTKANREFSVSGTDTADAAELAACINDATYGVEGVKATPAAAVITLEATEPGEETISASTSGATVTIATLEAVAYVGCLTEEIDVNDGFTHVAAKVTTTANSTVSALIGRGQARHLPTQAVGASAE